MTSYDYVLHINNGTGEKQSSYVYAENKTKARALVAKFYRADTPGGERNGFQPFHKTRIEWTRAEIINDPDTLRMISFEKW